MKKISAEECVERILIDIEKRKVVDYADKNSVRRYNAGMRRIIEMANYLCDNYPDKMDLLTVLLDNPDYNIAATCTGVLFILHGATKEHKVAALASAKQLLHREINPIDRMGWMVNVERWEEELQNMAE